MTEIKMDPETSVAFKQLTRLIARSDFINLAAVILHFTACPNCIANKRLTLRTLSLRFSLCNTVPYQFV
jgi:hypothetical protein